MSDTTQTPSTDTPENVSGVDAAFLRAEIQKTQEKVRQARLLGEAGEVAEREGDEPAAARDYLAAFNADPTFREPLEALVRLLERRRSLKNLGRVIDALVRAAITPSEKARALVMRAAYAEDVQGDVEVAKGSVQEALQAGLEGESPAIEAAIAALTMEMIAARLDDAALREEALLERVKHTTDGTWRALLRMDLARLANARGDVEKALALLGEARGAGSEVTFLAALASERLAKSDAGLPGSDEASQRSEAYADALEVQAALVAEALADPTRAQAFGVPRWALHPAFLVDAYLRAADVRRLRGEVGRAASLLDRAIESMASLAPAPQAAEQPVASAEAPSEEAPAAEAPSEEAPAAEAPAAPKPDNLLLDALLSARMRVAELLGDTASAATLAERRLEKETDGPTIAALAMRVAEQAASEGDAARALEAVTRAVKGDPACIPARALQLDILADSGDSAGYAEQLEGFADAFASDDARARSFLLAAFVWAVRAGDVPAARAALTQAQLYGAPLPVGARVARMLALVTGDAGWQDEANRRVIASGAEGGELASLWFDTLRARLVKGDGDGARKALAELAAVPEGAWLGRALQAFLPGVDANPAGALRALAAHESDPEAARALEMVAALRAVQAGDADAARGILRELVSAKPEDLLAATFLGDLEIGAGDATAGAIVVEQAAAALEDPVAAASLWIEAGLLRWRIGDKPAALDAFEHAAGKLPAHDDGRPSVAQSLLEWATRGVEPDTVEARRRAIARASDAGNDPLPLGLERFAAELVGGDSAAAGEALASVEAAADGDLAIAAALGRLLWPDGTSDRAAFGAAMDRLREAGSAALAASERYRAARDGEPDEAARMAREWFEAGGGAAAALEWLLCAARLGDAALEAEAREALGRTLGGEAGEQVHAWAGMLRELHGAKANVQGDSEAARLARVEIASPGSDPRRRAAALCTVGDALGEETHVDAMAMGAWSLMLMGDVEGALEAFAAVAQAQPDDLASWEGMRTAAEAIGQKEAQARAAEELGARCGEASRGAAFLEEAANLWLELGSEEAGEAALDQAFARDPKRGTAFDTLFRRVRARKDGEKLLVLITKRLENTDDPPEVAKLFWEQARVLREKGDADGALNALENVTMIEPDHVGALALTGEIFIRRQMYAEAADRLSHLASLEQAPPKNRITAGVASVDLYENKLDQPKRAVEVLMMLHKAGLSTLPVRERLAKAAARTGAWQEAVTILDQLMEERKELEGRVDAARLAMTIRRDKLGSTALAAPAVTTVLEALPGDGEALDLLLEIDAPNKTALLRKGRDVTLTTLQKSPGDIGAARRLVRLAAALGDTVLEGPAAAVAAAVGGSDGTVDVALGHARARQGRALPQLALSPAQLKLLAAPGDDGPIAALFALLGPSLAEALGPALSAIGVGKRDKIDPRSGLQTRNDIAAWAGAFGIVEFDLYVGGKDPSGVQGVPGEIAALVVGPNVRTPFDSVTAGRVARELFAISRGTTCLRFQNETTVAAIVVAACHIAEVPINAPPYAMLGEVEKALKSALPRRTRKALPEVCAAIAQSALDPKVFARAALASQARAAVIAAGEVLPVLAEMSPPALPGDPRAMELMKFVLSPAYIELRRGLGLEGGSP